VAGDRVAKLISCLLWAAAAVKEMAHANRREAALAWITSGIALLLLAASCWRRSAYVRHTRWLTAGHVVFSHIVASVVCVSGVRITASRWVPAVGCFQLGACGGYMWVVHAFPADGQGGWAGGPVWWGQQTVCTAAVLAPALGLSHCVPT